jgi:hypothetical protein
MLTKVTMMELDMGPKCAAQSCGWGLTTYTDLPLDTHLEGAAD